VRYFVVETWAQVFRQTTSAHIMYIYYVTLQRLISLMPIQVKPLDPFICIPERFDYGLGSNKVVAMIVILNRKAPQLSWKVE